MRLDIEVNNKTQSPVADGFFAAVARKTLEEAGYGFLREKNISISVALVSEEEMRKLNREHRQKDSVTDILSFFEYGSAEEIGKVAEEDVFLGELVLCYDDIRKYALEQGTGLPEELADVFSHGVLHLLGFAHGDKMFGLQDKVVKNF